MSSTLRLYQDDYHTTQHPDGTFATSLVEALRHIPPGTQTLMDVGCSRGDFGQLVKSIRPQIHVTGLEFAPKAAALARQHLDQVFETDLQAPLDLPIGPHSLDCITALDVIEHVIEPDFTLRQLLPYLKPTGILIVSIPNVRWQGVLQGLLYHGRWQDGGQIIQPPHLRYFTLQDILALLAGVGLNPITDISCVGVPLAPLMSPLVDLLASQGIERHMLQAELQTVQYVFGASQQAAKVDMNLNVVTNRTNWSPAEIVQLLGH